VFPNLCIYADGKNSSADVKSGTDENYFYEYATFSNFYILFWKWEYNSLQQIGADHCAKG